MMGLENERAVFFVEKVVATEEDPYGEDAEIEDWVPYGLADSEWSYDASNEEVVYDESDVPDIRVRADQQDAEYVRDVYGEWPMTVYRLFVEPADIGTVSNGSYKLGVSADDRVELAGVTGRFSLEPPNLQRLDSVVPEFVQIEVTKVAD